MGYTSQQYLEYLHQDFSDQTIADEVKYSRETITRIRLGTPGYNGNRINKKLEKIVRQLQAEQAEQEPQRAQPQVAPPVAAPPRVVTPVQPTWKVAPVAPTPKTGFTPQYVRYCGGCRGLLRTPREWQIGYHSNCR